MELDLVQQQIDENQAAADKFAASDKREDYEKELEAMTKVEGPAADTAGNARRIASNAIQRISPSGQSFIALSRLPGS